MLKITLSLFWHSQSWYVVKSQYSIQLYINIFQALLLPKMFNIHQNCKIFTWSSLKVKHKTQLLFSKQVQLFKLHWSYSRLAAYRQTIFKKINQLWSICELRIVSWAFVWPICERKKGKHLKRNETSDLSRKLPWKINLKLKDFL